MIVNANLIKVEIEKPLRGLRSHPKVIGCTTDDIKGINPSICIHRIHLKNDYTPSIEPQR